MKFFKCDICGNFVELVLADGESVLEVYAFCNLHGLWKAE